MEEKEYKSLIEWFVEDLGKYKKKLVLLYYGTILLVIFIGIPYTILVAATVISLIIPDIVLKVNIPELVIILGYVCFICWCLYIQRLWLKRDK